MRKLLAAAWLVALGGVTLVGLLSEPLGRMVLAVVLSIVITAWAVLEVME